MVAPSSPSTLVLILTSSCNLSCSYCYQNAKRTRGMSLRTLTAALDLVLSNGRPHVKVIFSGGEPLLEFPLVQKAVAYVESACPPDKEISYVLVTNGILMTESRLDFLEDHSFEIQLSCDGVKAAQDLRGEGTFAKLDRLLHRLRTRRRRFYAKNVKVSLTVTPENLKFLADSVDYFLDRNVHQIAMAYSIGDCSEWNHWQILSMEEQFERVRTSTFRHFVRTGRIPTLFLQSGPPEAGARVYNSTPVCRAPNGDLLAVDVDGRVFGCVSFVDSYQRFASKLMKMASESVCAGSIHASAFNRRRAMLPKKARKARVFFDRRERYSSYGRCRDCRYISHCLVCPASIGNIPGNEDPRRVPDFCCAFNRQSITSSERFWSQVLSWGQSPAAAPAKKAKVKRRQAKQ